MKVLVTGGGGFAGRHLIRDLVAAGYEEIGATTLGAPPPPDDVVLARAEWFPMDLTDQDEISRVIGRFRPTVVFHLAGQASVGQSLEAPIETWDVNALGTVRILFALRRLPAAQRRFLLVSSAEVYGFVSESDQPIGEDAPYRPVTPYGASKAAAEIAVFQEVRGNGLEVVIARSFNHIGPGQDDRFVVSSMARQLARIEMGVEEPVLRAGNLSVRRDFLDVRDAVSAYRCLMERGRDLTAYNVCSGVALSLADVVRRMIELSATGAKLELDPGRMRSVDIPSLVGDSSRLRGLGWTPQFDLDRTLRDLLSESLAER